MRSFLLSFLICLFSWTNSWAELGRRKISEQYKFKSSQIKVAFFDADSTLRVSKSGSVSANGPNDFEILPGTVDAIQRLNADGYFVAIVSNQAGIPRYISRETADEALKNLVDTFARNGAIIDYYDFAENYDSNRKPGVGMANRLERLATEKLGRPISIDRKKSFMVGDAGWKKGEQRPDGREGFSLSNSDRLFAENYGIPFREAQDFFGWQIYGYDAINTYEECQKVLASMGK
jgi:DNA 3'-phosphatase